MKYHELEVAQSSKKRRVGRGISAGGGKTAGRGTKGQKARTGKKIKPGFEGGQTKLAMRLPKARGFTSRNKVQYVEVTLMQLATCKSGDVTNKELVKAGLVRSLYQPVKVLGSPDAKLDVKLTVKLQAATNTAIKAIEAAGGSFTATSLAPRKKPTQDGTK